MDVRGRRDEIAHWFATSRLFARVLDKRYVLEAAADAGSWLPAVLLAVIVRFELHIGAVGWRGAVMFALLAAIAQIAFGVWTGLYSGMTRYGTFDELPALAASVSGVIAFTLVANTLWLDRLVPNGTSFAAGSMALAAMVGVRFLWRVLWESRLRPSEKHAKPALIFGAGGGGEQLVTAMVRDPRSPLFPVGLLDDDPRKAVLRIKGVPMLGNRDAIARAAEATGAKVLIIAIPSADARLVRDITAAAVEADLDVSILPPVTQMLGASLSVADVRPVTDADLLGRHPVDTDVAAIAGYLTGRRVLVTGAGGSIGSELCRQISRFNPAALVMLDRDESALHALQLTLEGRALLDSELLVVADIRDAERVHEVFVHHRPDVVFHAAALKHLTLLERHPTEAWKTNVVGSQNVLEAAVAAGVGRFVNISTDKAAEPTSVLGYSKRVAERLTAAAAERSAEDGSYLSVRFGNVLGSRGSVLTAFRYQIDQGGPVTVTHPDVTRFFMTVEEAVQLVIQAGAIGRSGEVLVLDMGEPVRILDVARQMIAASGRDIEIEFSGLRPGEKLHEVLASSGEEGVRPFHPLISHSSVPAVSPSAIDGHRDNESMVLAMKNLGSVTAGTTASAATS